jgi:alkylation response protein AidB-like acyl-CoA dehydrogenase
MTKDAEGRNLYRAYLVPKSDVDFVEGSWEPLGLRATSSLDYDIIDKYVPARRSFEFPPEGLPANGPISAMEIAWLNQVGLTAFASGMTRRLLSEFIAASATTKRLAAQGFQSESLVVQTGVGEFEGRLSAARANYRQLVMRQDEAVAQGAAIAPALRAELSLGCQTLSRAAREAALFAFENSATSVVYASSPILRAFRDLMTGLKHGTFSPTILSRIGRAKLGLPPLPMPF